MPPRSVCGQRGVPVTSRRTRFNLTQPGALRLWSTEELLQLPPPTWLIEDILPTGGLVGLYGAPGSFKSFLAIDIALSVGTGLPWQGHAVRRGFALYISAEGGTGIGKRAQAWITARRQEPAQAHVAWLTEAIPVSADSDYMERLLSRLNDEVRERPGLVIIDTLARCFDGDENQQEDMGRFIGGVDKLRQEFKATVIVVHHTRLDGERERGNTAFRGAADTMISIARKGQWSVALTCNKQKDAEEFKPVVLKLQPVSGTDSCVIAAERGLAKTSKVADVLQVLQRTGPMTWDAWFHAVSSTPGLNIPRTSFSRYVVELKETGAITKENGVWRV